VADLLALKTAIGDLDENEMDRYLEGIVKCGAEVAQDALKACQDGMSIVGERFEAGEYFVSDLIYAGELMIKAVDTLKPLLIVGGSVASGRMILCSVKGDLHDIGKNIVKSMLEAASIEVIDLGIDVAPEVIVREAKEKDAHIIGLSGVLTLALDSMKETVDAFIKAGMRESVKIIIGGSPVSEVACKHIGADAWAYSPNLTVKTCVAWAEGLVLRPHYYTRVR